MERHLAMGVLLAVSVVAQPTAAQTQVVNVGGVTELAALGASSKCPLRRRGSPSPDALQIVRGLSTLQASAERRDTVFTRDRLLARKFVDARVDLNSNRLGTGILSLVPELGRCVPLIPGAAIRGVRSDGERPGNYRIFSRPDTVRGRRVDRLLIAVEHGGAVISWDKNVNAAHPMSIIALGREIALTGTTVVVMVDSIARTAHVLVTEGAVALLGGDALGSVFEFRPNQAPELLGRASPDLLRDITYHTEGVFQPPRTSSMWKKVGISVASLGAGYGIYYLIDSQRGKGNNVPQGRTVRSRNGTIVIRLPI